MTSCLTSCCLGTCVYRSKIRLESTDDDEGMNNKKWRILTSIKSLKTGIWTLLVCVSTVVITVITPWFNQQQIDQIPAKIMT